MTPRALLTAIGATALAFAIAIGFAADNPTGAATGSAATAASTHETAGAAGKRLTARHDPCAIAV